MCICDSGGDLLLSVYEKSILRQHLLKVVLCNFVAPVTAQFLKSLTALSVWLQNEQIRFKPFDSVTECL